MIENPMENEDPNTPVQQALAEHLKRLADHLTHDMREVTRIWSLASNTTVVGAYAEAVVRRFVRRTVAPLRVSTGAIFRFPQGETVNQEDLIIWAPNPATAIFDVDDFAIVPEGSVFGVIEIKKSDGTSKSDLKDFHDRWPCPSYWKTLNADFATGVVPALSVICHAINTSIKSSFEEDRASGRTVVLISPNDNKDPEANAYDVAMLVNFLQVVMIRYHKLINTCPSLLHNIPNMK
jgi:hypothetical protein